MLREKQRVSHATREKLMYYLDQYWYIYYKNFESYNRKFF